MRAAVGHLTRKIKIVGKEEDSLGGSVFVYHYIKLGATPEEDVSQRGHIEL